MSDGEQSEDGQVKSGVELSPSEDEETNDSLDIKPPQASSSSAYYGTSSSQKRKDKKTKDRSHRHRGMMQERERDPRDRGDGGRGRDHYREREHYASLSASSREQQHRSGRSSTATTVSGGGGGRDRGREPTQRDSKHHSTRYEMNPFYGEMRETYHSKRERDREHRGEDRERDREREYRAMRDRERDRDYERVRDHGEKQRRQPTDASSSLGDSLMKAQDQDKLLEDLRTRLLNKKSRYDSKHREREREMAPTSGEMADAYIDEQEHYEQKRESKRDHRHAHASGRHRGDPEDRERRHRERRYDSRGMDVVEIIESPDHHQQRHHHQQQQQQHQQEAMHQDMPRTAEEKEQDARRAKLLEADREMLRRKEAARDELKARRLHKEEENPRAHDDTDDTDDEISAEELNDEQDEAEEDADVVMLSGDEEQQRRERRAKKRSRHRRHRHRERRNRATKEDDGEHHHLDDNEGAGGSRRSSDSETSSSDASERSDGDEEDEEHAPVSPLSVGELAKSDRRHRRSDSAASYRSRSHSRTRSGSGSVSRSHSRSRSPLAARHRHRHHEESHTDGSSRSRSRDDQASRGDRRRGKPGDEDDHHDAEEDVDGDNVVADGRSQKKPRNDHADDDAAGGGDDDGGDDADVSSSGEVEVKNRLPPYYPGIQGCRSVEEFLCLNRIEEGTYGVVYRAKDKRTEEIVALKRLKMEKEKEGFPITSLREINTLLKGQHPNIVTVREIVVGSNMDKIFIVMDYVEHDLKSLMETMKHKKQVFLPGEVKCLTQQLLRAVAHLHDNWILHRDLKTSNLLLSHKGILKVGDFGLAREYGSPLKPYTSIVVTLWYRAPELLLCCKEYSTPIDIWSVGCIFAEFLSMAALFPGKTEIDQLNRIFKDLGTPNEKIWPGYNELPAVQKMTFTEYPVSNLRKKFAHLTSELGIGLLQGLLTFDPKQRLTAEVALQHSYFRELPLPIDPAMFPTWPAKSELGLKKALASSPKPPSGGGEFKKLGDDAVPESAVAMAGGFHLGGVTYAESRQLAMGPGFSLKF
ncbi:serine/threonine-protein kinase PITSLRE [Anopheles darlingi]|uniref:serine/threonine-protein kinase PITSLRE n=1 Tax=Anopheles darlingi TaxID=43151 RepID=UPI0021002EA2|nr:serine/threonine-protein kinase PITSLRE [Anopheles darlingi]